MDNSNGQTAIWDYSTASGTFTQNLYGPYPGWTAKAVADGPDGLTRILWDNTNGTASIWSLNNASGQFTDYNFGPYPNWTAQTLSTAGDNTTHVLWTNTDGRASLWNYSTVHRELCPEHLRPLPRMDRQSRRRRPGWPDANFVGQHQRHGIDLEPEQRQRAVHRLQLRPLHELDRRRHQRGNDNTTHVLWDNTNGQASLWNYSSHGQRSFTQNTYGPYSGWTAIGIGDGPDGRLRVLWDNTNGNTSIWSLDNVAGIFSQFSFGPYPAGPRRQSRPALKP